MRILYVSYMHPAVAPGGEQQIAFELFQASCTQGHDAYLLAALDIDHEAQYGKPGAPIVPMPGERRQYFFFPQNYDFLHHSVGDWRSLQFFKALVERVKPAVIHFHHYHRIGIEAIRVARLAAPDAVICLTFHEMLAICLADGQMVKKNSRELCRFASPMACHQCFPELRPECVTLRAARLKAVLQDCDMFIFPSEFVAERYLDWGLPSEKCVVIANGQAHPAPGFDTRQHSPLVNRFAFFGQFIDNKGIDTILEAIKILAEERRLPPHGLVLDINGGNHQYASVAYLEKVDALIKDIVRIGVGPVKIAQNGRYSRDQIEDRMRAADWVVVPSAWWEVFGLVASEAWMFGRPVIASAIGGLNERVRHGVNGFTFPPRDARALAELMASLIGDEKRWLEVNRSIEPPWTAIDMLNAHLSVWRDAARPQG